MVDPRNVPADVVTILEQGAEAAFASYMRANPHTSVLLPPTSSGELTQIVPEVSFTGDPVVEMVSVAVIRRPSILAGRITFVGNAYDERASAIISDSEDKLG